MAFMNRDADARDGAEWEGAPERAGDTSREALRRWLRSAFEPEVVRRRTHRCAIAACGLFACVVALAILRPGLYEVGPWIVKLRSVRNPLLLLGGAVLVTLTSARRKRSTAVRPLAALQLVEAWSRWTLGERAFALALAAKLAVTAVNLAGIPGRYLDFHASVGARFEEPLDAVFSRPSRYAQFERFFELCRRELPDDARVLYHGRSEGQILAYVISPRPVFMHPAERYVAWVGHQSLDLGWTLPDDELFPGGLPPPAEGPDLESFVAAHRITHEVWFVESDLAACRIEAIR